MIVVGSGVEVVEDANDPTPLNDVGTTVDSLFGFVVGGMDTDAVLVALFVVAVVLDTAVLDARVSVVVIAATIVGLGVVTNVVGAPVVVVLDTSCNTSNDGRVFVVVESFASVV